ncbi:MAG: hypothetical protein AAFV19_23550 [Pseudomonadota bacterium]
MIKSSLTPPTIDQATIDLYVAKARRERSIAFVTFLRAIFAGAKTDRSDALAQPIRAYPA